MIVVVKKKNIKKVVTKALVLLFLLAMFGAYYLHMSNVFVEMEEDITQKPTIAQKKELTKEEKLAIKLEKLFYKEAEIIVELIGQKHVRKVYVSKKSLLFHTDNETNIEPLLIKYGTNATYKAGIDYMTISVDLDFIVEENFINED